MRRIETWSLLALLRFVLAFIVVVQHMTLFTDVGPVFSTVARLGSFEAVLGFLLISGYSIGESYRKSAEGFYRRRAMRLYPVYLGAIAMMYLADPTPVSWGFCALMLVNVLFLNQALTQDSYVGPAWSLSLEVWHYALTPLFARVGSGVLRGLIWGSLATFVFYTCGRSLFDWPYHDVVGYGLNLSFLSFVWISGYLISREREKPGGALGLVGMLFLAHLGLLGGIALVYRLKTGDMTSFWEMDVIDVLFRSVPLLMVWTGFWLVLIPQKPAAAASGVLRLLGDISYPLYLTHIPVYMLLRKSGFMNPYLLLGAALVASVLFYLVFDFYSRSREKREKRAKPRAGLAAERPGLERPAAE